MLPCINGKSLHQVFHRHATRTFQQDNVLCTLETLEQSQGLLMIRGIVNARRGHAGFLRPLGNIPRQLPQDDEMRHTTVLYQGANLSMQCRSRHATIRGSA